MDVAASIRRGVRLLDKEVPGWRWRVNLDTFDVEYGDRCVLGQIFGGFYTGCDALKPWWRRERAWAVRHGFHIPGKLSYAEGTALFGDLNGEWRLAINETTNDKELTWTR